MPKTFNCPTCGGPLTVKGSQATLLCPYCSNSVIVPAELRAAPVQPAGNNAAPAARAPCLIYLTLAVVLVVGLMGAAVAFFVSAGPASFSQSFTVEGLQTEAVAQVTVIVGQLTQAPWPLPALEATPTPGFAALTLDFGGEGIGPGLFKDARGIGVDGDGNIYVSEYEQGGRVQVFDPTGKFTTQWFIDDKEAYLVSLAADRRGTVYAVYGSDIFRYAGSTGKLLGKLDYAEGWGFDDVSATADGGLVAGWYKNRDDLVRFDAKGKVVLAIQGAISEVSGDSELDLHVAADGEGNLYALGTFNNAVFKFSPEGKFLNRFGGEGDAPGQFRAPYALAVDGQGRVYVGDFKGIQVFDADGRYLALISVPDYLPAFGLVFNDQNELLVAARTRVFKYTILGDAP